MLKDEDTLVDRKVESGTTVTVVKGVDKEASTSSSSSSTADELKQDESP